MRSHFDGMEVRVADAPRANEYGCGSVTNSGRPLPRVGGLKKDEIEAWTGCDGRAKARRSVNSGGTTIMKTVSAAYLRAS